MEKREQLSPLTAEQLKEFNGGGFAYDVGRVLRFIGLCGGNGSGAWYALTDWDINKAINEA